MSAQATLRFVQASNLLLDRFCAGRPDLPLGRQRLLVDAPFRAAERVFDVVLNKQAAFLLLAGGVFRGETYSTWGCSFLARQCERLAARHIPVYWFEQPGQMSRWPAFIPRPVNLHLASRTAGQDWEFTAHSRRVRVRGGTIARSASAQRSAERGDRPFTIGVSVSDEIPSGASADGAIDYWAIRGGLASILLESPEGVVRTAGTPQGRLAGDGASGSCLLVDVGADDSIRTEPVPTAALAWHNEVIAVDDACNWEGFRRHLHARANAVVERRAPAALMLNWTVRGHGPVIDRLLRPSESAALAAEVHAALPGRLPPSESVIEVETDSVLASRWRTGRDDLASFVRAVDRLAAAEADVTDLADIVGQGAESLPEHARRVPTPHIQGKLKAAARRHAAEAFRPPAR